ncbi:hypothetical protein ACGFYV_05815 [Streptomyces sp. NPDC048297]|uniref:hypothetical protein n=1 Tax=Streptomyces sp. NPDC048297 TaxID=3365531 RepID=UPI0037230ED6
MTTEPRGGVAVGQVVRRGIRLGVRIGSVPALLFGTLWLTGGAMWLIFDRNTGDPAAFVRDGFVGVAGSLGVGVLLGAATGVVLALSPEWLASRAPLRGLLAGAVASTVFLGEALVVAVATDVGYGPVLFTFLTTPVAGVVAALHSGDVLGRTRHHPWVWGEKSPW